ncbi:MULTISPECIES: DEAD/DEAH box helicase [unclassified Phenylobacterium]|uniref:DEAD/DEAH box helicase n=1 Tax=unclassified Phenylobacterium TaxID=2640670 RepID=UPI0009E8304F|nr:MULTISPECIES: DEAD/DEAH box helicase [unclassified Phenylobacterium]
MARSKVRTAKAQGSGMLTPGPLPAPQARSGGRRQPPTAFIAHALVSPTLSAGSDGLIYIASNERRADEIARAMQDLAPQIEVLSLPPWDCLPYDRASPSRECMGRRMEVLGRLQSPVRGARAIIVSAETLLQRLPPARAVEIGAFHITCGQVLRREELEAFAASAGYVFDERIDEPGEIAILGEIIDIFPAASQAPVRVRLGPKDDVLELSAFDPLTQRSGDGLQEVRLGAASELVLAPAVERQSGQEHFAPAIYGSSMRSLLSLAPQASVALDPKASARLADVEGLIKEAYHSQQTLGDGQVPAPSALYLTARSVSAAIRKRQAAELDTAEVQDIPNFALARDPGRAFADQVAEWSGIGRRVVLTGLSHERAPMLRALKRHLDREVRVAGDWSAVAAAAPGDILFLAADLEAGFDDPAGGLALIAAADVLGSRMSARSPGGVPVLLADPDLRPGDIVIHEDHGLGRAVGLERVNVDGLDREALRVAYYGEASILAPVDELDKVWRYAGEAEVVSLDRLHTDSWSKRRAMISQDIDAAAAHLIGLARERGKLKGHKLIPPRQAYARFAARFPYPETADQARAIEAVLADLASGKAMQRLVCGDVGFGKTEVALRAAAAVALAGRQVAVVAPTTVLARQHFETFQRRFAGTGVRVAQLSRLVSAEQAQDVKAGLADGSIGVVIGTHALAGPEVCFDKLGLLVIDEEQRFGAKLKADLAALAPAAHRLTLTATPIPRTLQLAMVGVQDVSVIATPPARRRPIRTFLAQYDPATLRTALLREKARAGQSFLVVPRISDIEQWRNELERLCPKLSVRIAHGELPAEQVDETMVAFSAGDGDVLLATNIIESGLDVPRANTMLIWRADLFGLAQLHQLRGRVGRGRAQGVTYLFHDASSLTPATRARLGALEAFDRLGSGLAISTQDLEVRGAGDLTGDEQAGHVKLIGTALYQRLLSAAVRSAKGEADLLSLRPELNLGMAGELPEAYVPDETVRLNLYARLARLEQPEEILAFSEELEDRFGPLPDLAIELISAARLRALARAAGVARIDSGPKAAAFRFQRPAWRVAPEGFNDLELNQERLLWKRTDGEAAAVPEIARLLEALGPETRNFSTRRSPLPSL